MFIGPFFGGKCIIKERFEKKYRVPELDAKLSKRRILQEARNMARVRKNGVYTPHLFLIDEIGRKIYMEYLEDSITAKELLRGIPSYSDPCIVLRK